MLRGTVALRTGRYKEAIRLLAKEVHARPKNWEARVRLSEARLATGTRRSKLTEADELATYWERGALKGAAALAWLGRALHLTGYYKDSNQIFEKALELEPHHVQTHLFYAQLALELENDKHADEELTALLQVNPHHPEGLALMAQIDMTSDNDPVKATARITAALATDPRSVPALRAQAHVYLDTEQFPQALAVLDRALAVDPNDAKALGMAAAARTLLEDDAAARALTSRALAVNPHSAEVWHVMADYLVRYHRYRDAIALERKAIALDAEYWPAYVGLGIGYSRVGDDARANEYLQKAFEGNSFNVRAYNMTAFFYDGPAKRMVWQNAGPFRVRMEPGERGILKTTAVPLLQEAYAHHQKAYGFTPKRPLHVEIFKDPQVFAVRTSAYPGLRGIAGVCFGHVVTVRSPSGGDINWAMVMWHEMAHVWHAQMSRHRVPRWFTEGLAEYETTLHRPEWRRELDRDLLAAHREARLKGVDTFNSMFTQATSLNEVVLAYYYATKVVEFIHKRWGFPVFAKMLRAWGERKPTATVFREVLGMDTATFDGEMKKYLDTVVLARFAGEFEPAAEDAKDPPSDAYRRGLEALGRRDYAAAAAALDEVLAAGKDGVLLQLRRAAAAAGLKDWKGARTHAERAAAIDPRSRPSWQAVAEALDKLGDADGAFAARRKAVALSYSDLEGLLELLAESQRRGSAEDLRFYADRAMHVAPFDRRVRVFRGEALLADKKAAEALAEAEIALGLPGESADAAKRLQARALEALGRKGDAKRVLDSLKEREDGGRRRRGIE